MEKWICLSVANFSSLVGDRVCVCVHISQYLRAITVSVDDVACLNSKRLDGQTDGCVVLLYINTKGVFLFRD